MQSIGGHDLALDVDVFEQAAHFRNFVGFPGDFFLCDGRPLAMQESAEEMDLGPVFPDRVPLSTLPPKANPEWPRSAGCAPPSCGSRGNDVLASEYSSVPALWAGWAVPERGTG